MAHSRLRQHVPGMGRVALDHGSLMRVDVEFRERYWYPDDGGQVWLSGYQLVDPETGSYLGRDAPQVAGRGLRVAGVAGARHRERALESDALAPGMRARAQARARQRARPRRGRRCGPGARRSGMSRASWPPSSRPSSTLAARGRPSCCASSARHRGTRGPG